MIQVGMKMDLIVRGFRPDPTRPDPKGKGLEFY